MKIQDKLVLQVLEDKEESLYMWPINTKSKFLLDI